MTLRFGLCDRQRTGLNIYLAPDHLHAVVADNLGRVMLIDCFRGIAVRVWKGYRDAQCSFVKVTEKTQKVATGDDFVDKRQAIFLVIFAPRRSCLEIWGLQRGQKVAAFAASKSGQLIHNQHSLIGVSGGSRVKYPQNSCVFLDPTDQTIKEIIVPFHCAVTDANSKTAKDLHLLRRIKMLLRNGGGDAEHEPELVDEMKTACQAMQTDEIRLQCVEMLVKNSKIKPIVLEVALQEISAALVDDDVADDDDDDPMDDTSTIEQMQRAHLQNVTLKYSKLVEFYLYVKGSARATASVDATAEEPVKLSISDTELINLQKFIDLTVMENGTQRARVTFNDNTKSNAFVEYLTVFNCEPPQDVDDEDDWIRLKEEQRNVWASVGADIFAPFLDRGKSLTDFLRQAEQSRIAGHDLMKLFLLYWLDKPFSYTKRFANGLCLLSAFIFYVFFFFSEDIIIALDRFTLVLQQICAMEKESASYDYNAVNYWWQSIRELLLESGNTLMSLMAALMCRNFAARFRKREVCFESFFYCRLHFNYNFAYFSELE